MINPDSRDPVEVENDVQLLADGMRLIRDPLARYWLSMFFHMACAAASQFEARAAGETIALDRKGH